MKIIPSICCIQTPSSSLRRLQLFAHNIISKITNHWYKLLDFCCHNPLSLTDWFVCTTCKIIVIMLFCSSLTDYWALCRRFVLLFFFFIWSLSTNNTFAICLYFIEKSWVDEKEGKRRRRNGLWCFSVYFYRNHNKAMISGSVYWDFLNDIRTIERLNGGDDDENFSIEWLRRRTIGHNKCDTVAMKLKWIGSCE